MPTHKEFTAWISVDGRKLPEFKVTAEENGRKVACYIPSMPGQRFSVHWKDHGSNTFTAGYIQCDGFTAPGRFLSGHGEQMRSGIRSGPESERPFMFANIPKTTSRNVSNSPDPRHVGTIILKIMQAQRGPGRSSDGLRIVPGALSSEWSSTTGGHCATFSREEVKAPPQSPFTWSTKPMDPDDPHSHVKFIFFYRSMDWLVEHQIADPQSASIHLGNKIQFTVTPQQYPMYPMQGAMLGAPGYTAPPLVPAPIDMKVAQVNTLNPEKKDNDKGKDRVPSNSKPKREKKPKVEEELDDKPYIDPRLTTDIEELKRKIFPHLIDPSIPPPPYWFEKSDNQKRKEAREKKLAEKEAREREAERLEKEKKDKLEEQERRRVSARAQQQQQQQQRPLYPQPRSQPLPQQQTVQFYVPMNSRSSSNPTPPRAGQVPYPHSQAQALGYGRPPLAGRAATSSRITSAGGSSTRIASNTSTTSYASASTSYSHDYDPDYDYNPGSDTESADPGHGPGPHRLKRSKTVAAVPSAAPGPSARMDFGMRRDFSHTSTNSAFSIPSSSQESWESWGSDDKMDDY